MKEDVFEYFHLAIDSQSELMYDHMKGPGLTGLYAACGYNQYSKEVDPRTDEKMDHITDMSPLASDALNWARKKRHSITVRLVTVVARLMNAYQQYRFDLCSPQ